MKKQQQADIADYKNEEITCYTRVLYPTYRNRDPNAREWLETLPMAIGGACHGITVYQELVKNDLKKWLAKNCGDHKGGDRCQGFRYISINNNHKNFVTEFKDIDATRMAVALGLSYPISNFEEIKEFYKECEIEDIRPIMAKTDMEDNYTSKDQV